MKNPEDYVVLDFESGTYFPAINTVLINWKELTPEQEDIMVNGSDTERTLLADQIGFPYFHGEND